MANYIPFATDNLGLSTSDMINAALAWLGCQPGDFSRYPQQNIVNALNMGASKFAMKTKCLSMPVLMVMAANVQNYALPHNCLKITAGRYYYGNDRQSYQELEIKNDPRLMQMEDSVYRGYAGSPATYLFPTYKNNDLIGFGISPYPDTDGTTFNAANSLVTVLNAGIWPSTPPGTEWGLAIDVPAGGCSVIGPGNTDNGGSIGIMGDFQAFTDNLVLDVVRRPMPLAIANPDYVCELPYDYHDAIVAYAVWWLGRANYNGLTQDAKAKDALAVFSTYIGEYNDDNYQEESMSEVIQMDWLS